MAENARVGAHRDRTAKRVARVKRMWVSEELETAYCVRTEPSVTAVALRVANSK